MTASEERQKILQAIAASKDGDDSVYQYAMQRSAEIKRQALGEDSEDQGQEKFSRRRRISEGCCPIHGCGLGQAMPEEADGYWIDWAECPRQDCNIRKGYKGGDFNEPIDALYYEL